jgi:hypothetical protein
MALTVTGPSGARRKSIHEKTEVRNLVTLSHSKMYYKSAQIGLRYYFVLNIFNDYVAHWAGVPAQQGGRLHW